MKKFLRLIVTIAMIIMLSGCFNSFQPSIPLREIRIYTRGEESMSASIQIVDRAREIKPGDYILAHQYVTQGLFAALYIDGVPQPDQVTISEDLSEPGHTHCFVPANVYPALNGLGTYFDARWDAVGKSRLKAEVGEEVFYCTVFTYDSIQGGMMGYNNGLRLWGLNERHLSNVKSECFLWADPDENDYVLTGKSYIAGNTSVQTWRIDLYNVKSVDLQALESGITNRPVSKNENKIIVAENPYVPGSYVKFVKPGNNYGSMIWDYTESTSFRQ